MFVRYFLELPLAASQVERAVVDAPAGWLARLAGQAQQRGDRLLTEVGVGPLGARRGRRVTIQLGTPVRFASMTSLPLTWEPVGLEGLLPRLEADLELGSLGRTGPSWPSAPATSHPWEWSAGPSTGSWCTGSPRPPSRTSWTGSGRPSP